jgi:hypothetical protein
LLDVTTNALVGLYFACEEYKDKDGKVIILQIPQDDICYYDSDKITILSNLSKQNKDFEFNYDENELATKKEKAIKKVNKKYFGYLLHSIREDKPHFFPIINPKHIEKVYAVFAKLDNQRIIRQNGAFLVFGIKKTKNECAQIDKSWILKEITIPKKDKEEILSYLEILGIKKSTLFPELDEFAEFLKQKYKKDTTIIK